MNKDTIALSAMDELLTKAMGARSMTEFAKSCGVSPMSISRIKSGTKPSKKMCLKLSLEPYVKSIGLTSRDFLEAAGYTDESEIESVFSYEQVLTEKLDTIAVGLISKKLLNRQATYQIVPSHQELEYDFEVRLVDDYVTSWNIILERKTHVPRDQMKKMSYYYYLGRLLSLEPEKGRQYSMILNDRDIYEDLLKRIDRKMVKANVSVAYLDSKKMQVLQEDHFGNGEYISLVEEN